MSLSPARRCVNIKLNGKTFKIEIDNLDQLPLKVRVNGEPYEVVLEDAPSEPIREPTTPATTAAPIAVHPSAAPGAAAPASYSTQEIRSPMPGNILDIAVAVGDTVQVGQPLCALEAMKMKSRIRSPREGVINGVHVTEGQVVIHGELLFTFE